MKISRFNHTADRTCFSRRAYTLLEVMMASGILVIVIAALLSAQLIGLREDQVVESKAGASDSSRRVLNQLPADIRSAKLWFIGDVSGNTFTPIAAGSAQQGTALELFETTNGSPSVIYYFDLTGAANSNTKLMRTTNLNNTASIMASNLITSPYFRAEDYNGNIATNEGTSKAYKNVIHATLQFCQFEYPMTQVSTNGLYDYYKMEFKATPHLPE